MGKIRDIIAKARRPKGIGGDIRTVFSITYSVHNKLVSRYKWYDNWHQKQYATQIHCQVLAVFIITVIIGLGLLLTDPVSKPVDIKAEADLTTLIARDDSGVLKPQPDEKEIVEKRTENFKTFQLPNGTFRAVGSIEPIHYKTDPFDLNEQFKEIDLTIRDHQKQGVDDWDYAVEQNGYQVHIWNSRKVTNQDVCYIAQFRRAGKFIEMAPSELVWENAAGDREVISKPLSDITPEIDNENYTVTWKNVFGEGINFRYNIAPDKFFKTIIINSRNDLPEPTIDQDGLRLTVVMAVDWDEGAKISTDFFQGKTADLSSKTATEKMDKTVEGEENDNKRLKDQLKDPDEQREIADPVKFDNEEDRGIWWIGKPEAWDSSSGPKFYELNQSLSRIGENIFNNISLDKSKISDSIEYPLFIDTTVNYQVAASANDGTWSNVFYGTHYESYAGVSTISYHAFARFTGVAVPQGSTVTSATYTVYATASSGLPVSATDVYMNNEDNPTAIVSVADGNGRALTSAIGWNNIATWTASTWYNSPDISSVVQTVVNRAGWSSGNAMQVIHKDNVLSGTHYIAYRAYDNSPTNSAKLSITYSSTISIAGSCKQYDESTNCADGETVKVAVNGNLQAQTTTTSSGTWTISGVTAPTSGDTITVFVDDVDDDKEANAVTKYDGSGNITGIGLYERHLSIGSGDNQTLSNADMNKYDGSVSSDEDIFFDIDALDNLTMPYSTYGGAYTDQELYILASNTWQPKSSSSCTSTIPNLEIPASATLTADGNTITLSASSTPFVATGTFTYNTSTIKYTGASATNITGTTYYNLYFDYAGTTFTAAGDITISNVLTNNAGTFDASNRTITLSGSGTPFVNSGSFTASSSTVNYIGMDATTIANVNYYNLTLNGANETYTKLLLHTDGTNGSTTFTDSSASPHTVTAGGAAQLSTAQKKFGTASGYFEGTTSKLTVSNNSDFDFGSGNFTIDWWEYRTANDTSAELPIIARNDTASITPFLVGAVFSGGTTNYVYMSSNGSSWDVANGKTLGTIDLNTWNHFALVRSGNTYYTFKNGTQSDTWSNSATLPDNASPVSIGKAQNNSYYYKGYIDELRVSKGVARWTSDFTPPTIAYTLEAATFAPSSALTSTNNLSLSAGTFTAGANNIVLNSLSQSGGTFIASASNLFIVSGNYNKTSGTFTDSGGTLTLNGSAAQAITAGGTGAGDDFTNMIVTNASTDGVTFNDSTTVTGTFTDTTASSKLTFHSGSTYAFNAISINGQATGTRVVLTSSSSGSAWNFNITEASPVASNVSVKDSNANKDIDATTGGYNATGNTHWLFPSGNTTPTNDSLTFTNPYSTNVAIADDTTEWNFQALVTDADGSTDINYVELRFANSADATQPYDSLKFRWTEATDAFSEEADTQSAATLTSTSANSNVSGNQWTLDFKIKINNSFLAKDTNYAAELYTIDDASASDNDNYVNLYQVTALSLTLDVDSATIAFGNLLPGSVITGTTITTVTTNYPNGYSLAASDGVAGSDSCLLHTDTTTRIADYTGTIATPTSWTGTGLGISLYSATGKDTSKWGTGTTETDSNNKYAGVPQNATTIHSKTGSPTSSDESKIGYKLVVPNTQKTGDYSGNITYTATGALN